MVTNFHPLYIIPEIQQESPELETPTPNQRIQISPPQAISLQPSGMSEGLSTPAHVATRYSAPLFIYCLPSPAQIDTFVQHPDIYQYPHGS